MKSHNDINDKLESLRQRLEALGHFPSQKEDRALHANAKYYYTHYPDNEVVRELMKRFPKESSNSRTRRSKDEVISLISEELSKLGYVPGPTENRFLYSKVKYCYENFSDRGEVKALMEKYPLESKRSPSMFANMEFDEKIDLLEKELDKIGHVPHFFHGIPYCEERRVVSNVIRYYRRFADHPKVVRLMTLYPLSDFYSRKLSELGSAKAYMEICFNLYGRLPGERTSPMESFCHKCREQGYMFYLSTGEINPYMALVKYWIEHGANSAKIKSIYEEIKY